jgi:Flp pilus assembly protein TadG
MRGRRSSEETNRSGSFNDPDREGAHRILRESRQARDKGILFAEAALLLPVVLTLLFGAVEVGNWYLQGFRLANLSQNLATGVQQSPTISAHDMYRLTVSSSSLAEVKKNGGTVPTDCSPNTCEIKDLTTKIVASTTPINRSSVGSSTPSKWTNPWLADSQPSNDRKPYYVGVLTSYPRTTLFSRLFPSTRRIERWSTVVVNPAIQPRVTTVVRFYNFQTYGDDTLQRLGGYRRIQIGEDIENETIPPLGNVTGPIPIVTDVVKAQHGDNPWGLKCREEEGWFAVSCGLSTHADGSVTRDRDLVVRENGCFADNEEREEGGRIHLGCMKVKVD